MECEKVRFRQGAFLEELQPSFPSASCAGVHSSEDLQEKGTIILILLRTNEVSRR